MLQNYFRVALRNLLRYRTYSFLNLAGLGVGLATSILILLWVRDERSFDRFHDSSSNIYRITAEVSGVNVPLVPLALSKAIQEEIPEIINTAQVAFDTRRVSVGEKSFEEKRVYYADPDFFGMFNFLLIKGDKKTALSRPDGMLLTEAMVEKYFGGEDPIGKTVLLDKDKTFVIAGVLENVPSNSHIQFDFLLPMEFFRTTLPPMLKDCWACYINTATYAQLSPVDLNTKKVADQMNAIYVKQKQDMKVNFGLQPLHDIHLYSQGMLAEYATLGDGKYVQIFSFVAVFILVVASINFMNLATARAARRAKEVGMRKVLGAYSRQLIAQFLGEALLISFLSLIIAVFLVELSLPYFNSLIAKELKLSFDPTFVFGLFAIVGLTGILAGSYPALYLSSFRPIQSLKGIFKSGPKSIWFRNGLVVVQFVVTIVMLIGTVLVHRQIDFIQNQNLGFDKANLLYVQLKGEMNYKYKAIHSALEASAVANNFTLISELPTNLGSATYDVKWDGKNPEQQIVFPTLSIDEHSIETMGMQVIAGRSFSKEFTADTSNYVLNEKAVRIMGMDPQNAVGAIITMNGVRGEIIGVVKDFHFKPIQQAIEPLIMDLNRFSGIILVKAKPSQTSETIAELERVVNSFGPTLPFEYGFVDQRVAALYQTESQISSISGIFAMLSIFIACLGLFGLSAFMAEQRIKEIGVRKVLGATVANIIVLLSKGFMKPLIVSIVLAIPLGLYLMNTWLTGYAYHVSLDPWIFVAAGLFASVIALATTSFQSIRAALANPVKSLKNE